jgi:hypothetical protein
MAEQVKHYLISNNNSSKKQVASLTVKTMDGVILARIYSKSDRILQRVRRYAVLDERTELVEALKRAGVPDSDIAEIIAPKVQQPVTKA